MLLPSQNHNLIQLTFFEYWYVHNALADSRGGAAMMMGKRENE